MEHTQEYALILTRNEIDLLTGIVELLESFNVFTTYIQGSEYVTINTLVLFYTEIRDRLEKTKLFSLNITVTKAAEILLSNLDHRFLIEKETIAAAIFDPRMQRLLISIAG